MTLLDNVAIQIFSVLVSRYDAVQRVSYETLTLEAYEIAKQFMSTRSKWMKEHKHKSDS